MGTDREIIDALGGHDPAEHELKARERWGDTEAFHQSAARTKRYTPDDWTTIRAAEDDITDGLAKLWRDGAAPDAGEALELAETWRRHVTRWFYDCPTEFLRAIGEMYVSDPRFRVHFDLADGARAGFADWVRDVWVARADQG